MYVASPDSGSLASAVEDSYGLKIKARFSSVPKAQAIRTKMVEGHLRGLSFIYEPLDHYRGQKGGQPVRFLRELRLYEATVSPVPRNLLALGSAKATAAVRPVGLDSGLFEDSLRKALDIGYEPARKAALVILLKDRSTDESAADSADGQDAAVAPAGTGEPPAGTAQGKAEGAADYAVAFLDHSDSPDGALGGDSPKALVDPLAVLDIQAGRDEQDRQAAEIRKLLGGTT